MEEKREEIKEEIKEELNDNDLEAVSGGNWLGLSDEEYAIWQQKALEKLRSKHSKK